MDQLPPDFFTTTSAYTPHVYRDQYPSIDPASAALSQAGKVIVITGTSAGIGARGFAPAFAKAGPKAIVLVGRDVAKLKATEESIKLLNQDVETLVCPTEVADESSVSVLFSKIKSSFGHADVLVNNAGAFSTQGLLDAVDQNKWWRDFEVNVRAIATSVTPGLSSYSISKLAVIRLSEYIAAEYGNVSSVALQPGVVDTDLVVDAFKRFALDTPELVGGMGVWLATDHARFLSGRSVSANWSVDDLMARKDELLAGNDLKIVYQGKFRLDQFSVSETRG